ncbi:MAG: dihydrolipoamide acetyltransferase family protein [Chitinophagales bacterium]
MAIVDLVMPKMGESIMEATILKWHKQPGDAIMQDETLLEIATDKVDSEVPSTAAGTLQEILFRENEVVPVGSVIARIQTEISEPARATHIDSPADSRQVREEVAEMETFRPAYELSENVERSSSSNGNGSGNRFYSPLVLNIASNEGISLQELEKLSGSGNEGRVTKKDILQYVHDKKHGVLPRAAEPVSARPKPREVFQQSSATEYRTAATVQAGNTEILEMDRMRKLIADHMVRSKQTSAHVTSFTEADVTNLVRWREQVKGEFEKREGTKITFTPLFIEAIVMCIKKFPMINSSVDGDRIIIKKDINLGMATALPNGNLIVPVIHNADQFNLVGLTKQVNTLADNARNNKLRPEDTQGGTFTMTNVGTFGSLMGTPIINQPQVAILALGAIKKRPMVIESSEGDSIAIRHMMYLSLSYDHRIIDGSLGASFLTEVANSLEKFSPDKTY